MNIAIMMSVGCQNLGDELILKNEIQLLREKYGPKSRFRVFTYDMENIFYKDEGVEYLEYFPIGIKNPKNILRNMKNYFGFIKTLKWSNIVVIGGGGVFFDNESGNFSNPLKQWLFRSEIMKLLKKEYIIFGVSIDIKMSKNIPTIKKIFSASKEVFVRDNSSFEFLKNIGISSQMILDPVFHDNGEEGIKNYQTNYLLKKVSAGDFSLNDLEGIDFTGKTIGFALREGYLQNETELIKNMIQFILNKNGKIILLPHSFHQIDTKANDLAFLNTFLVSGVSITKNMEETYDVYKQKKIDFCLSMRLHSMILSQVYGIEFIAIKYAKKSDLM